MRNLITQVVRATPAGLFVLLVALGSADALSAQDTHDHAHDHPLHFTHPLIAESISPDTKLRADYTQLRLDGNSASDLEFEGEYAFTRGFSLEAGVHLDPEGGEFGETHLIAKLASYALEDRGVLLGGGLSVGLPTGSGHGHGLEEDGHDHHDHGHGAESDDLYEFEPFLTGGVKGESWEAISWAIFTLPTEGNSALGIQASFLYHLSPRLQALLEYQGDTVLGDVPGSRHVSTLAPALKVRPFAESGLAIGAGVRVPLTEHRAFDTGALFSVFYHF